MKVLLDRQSKAFHFHPQARRAHSLDSEIISIEGTAARRDLEIIDSTV